eukprot:5777049-Pyramimonas_sp.AAC.1
MMTQATRAGALGSRPPSVQSGSRNSPQSRLPAWSLESARSRPSPAVPRTARSSFPAPPWGATRPLQATPSAGSTEPG